MITKIQVPRLRNSEMLQLVYDVVTICNKKQPEILKIDNLVNALQASNIAFDNLFKTEQSSAYSNQINELDNKRDKYINGIRTVAYGFTNHFDVTTAEAASMVLVSIDKYGTGIARLNHQAETSTIKSIIDNWEKDQKLINALQTLSLSAWANELKTANNEFNNVFISRIEESAQKPTIAANDARKEVYSNYQTLIKHIEARATIDTDNMYKDLIAELNALMDKYGKMLAVRMA